MGLGVTELPTWLFILLAVAAPIVAVIGSSLGFWGLYITSKKRLEHETAQAQIARRVEARTGWISQMQLLIGDVMQLATQAIDLKITVLVFAWREQVAQTNNQPVGSVSNTREAVTAAEEYLDVQAAFTGKSRDFLATRFQNPDGKLHRTIEEFGEEAGSIEIRIVDQQAKFLDSTISNDEEAATKAANAVSSEFGSLFSLVGSINQRLEELLEGVETKPFSVKRTLELP